MKKVLPYQDKGSGMICPKAPVIANQLSPSKEHMKSPSYQKINSLGIEDINIPFIHFDNQLGT